MNSQLYLDTLLVSNVRVFTCAPVSRQRRQDSFDLPSFDRTIVHVSMRMQLHSRMTGERIQFLLSLSQLHLSLVTFVRCFIFFSDKHLTSCT